MEGAQIRPLAHDREREWRLHATHHAREQMTPLVARHPPDKEQTERIMRRAFVMFRRHTRIRHNLTTRAPADKKTAAAMTAHQPRGRRNHGVRMTERGLAQHGPK